MKIMAVVGTRPEIIRLSRILSHLDDYVELILVHTGQNYDYNLNEVFFDELGLRPPSYVMDLDTSSLGRVLGGVIMDAERIIGDVLPDAMVVLGDTNSSVAAIVAKRMKVPVFHLEAGNRSFDPNVPEEINRRIVDHVSDYNLVYSEHSRRNLLREGLFPANVMLMGSPMKEVLDYYHADIMSSEIVSELGLESNNYLLASIHREENVDSAFRLKKVVDALDAVSADQGIPVLLSTHPRTRKRLVEHGLSFKNDVRFHEPLGFMDYNRLQLSARCVLSDSGTISEESSILGFPAVTLRDTIERPESLDSGSIICTGLEADDVILGARVAVDQFARSGSACAPYEYLYQDCSRRVVNFVLSKVQGHHLRNGIRL